MQDVTALQDRTGSPRAARADATGRLGVNYHFRDITATGYASLTRGQEATVISGVATEWHDAILVSAANTSTAARSVNIRMATGGGVQDTLTIPAGNTVIKEYLVPLMQDEQGAAITAQDATGADLSDSTVTVQIIAIKNT